ncbi:MAG: type II toxin-antitoxin system prevent-host-death family antitoxin [Promicromonosporaceae bacterium]|nr:type II toxin-antitoxin system prevent-host-death family antitoxin [Promicromonosporaceae bacterium]
MTTTTVGIRELTHNAGSLVRAAAMGARIIVTDRGRPVANLVPHRDSDERQRREAAETASLNAMLSLVDQSELLELASASDAALAEVPW